MTSYTEKLEDIIWCNDRTFYSSSLVGKDFDTGASGSYFSANNRVYITYNPSVTCPNEERDGFTVSTTSGGNGALTYPVGLLTADEVMLAGGNRNSNLKYYLYTGEDYWTLSPSSFGSYSRGFVVYDVGTLKNETAFMNSFSVRPSVSLAPGTKTFDGNGTADNPYVIGDE